LQHGHRHVAERIEAAGGKTGATFRMREIATARGLWTPTVPRNISLPPDDPRVLAARAGARRGHVELLRLLAERRALRDDRRAAVQLRVGGELVWADVIGRDCDGLRVILERVEDDVAPVRHRVRHDAIEDWYVRMPDGTVRGHFVRRAVLAHALDEYGTLDAATATELSRLEDNVRRVAHGPYR